MIRHILFITLLTFAGISISAKDRQDSTFLFRFVADKDMFYSPWKDNREELDRLTDCINQNRAAIDAGELYLYVTSYGTKGNETQSAAEVAKIRRNRVKSELILRTGIKEENFVTDQGHTYPYNEENKSFRLVVVIIKEAYPGVSSDDAAQIASPVGDASRIDRGETPGNETGNLNIASPYGDAQQISQGETLTPPHYNFALRANLLRWLTLTPDLGIEFRTSKHLGILINGSYTSWGWKQKEKRYSLWEVAPELRVYLGHNANAYLGAQFKVGSFDYKFSEPGKQGDIIGGGITGGYQLPLSRSWMLDFSLGLGYLNADYETYTVENNCRERKEKKKKDYFGPISVGVSLVWNIF